MSWTYAAQEREKKWRKAHPDRVKEIKRKSNANAKLKAKEKSYFAKATKDKQ